MRDHAIVSPKFWTGETGRFLRNHPEAQRLALYLITCPSSNMIGLYYLPIPTICHELTMTTEGASKALRRVFEGGFADYDEVTETVFVFEMARFQVGERLAPKDNRIKAVVRQLETFHKSRFYADFLKRYGRAFWLTTPSPFEAPSKPLRSQEQEQDQDQDKEQGLSSRSAPVFTPVGTGKISQKTSATISDPAALASRLGLDLASDLPIQTPPESSRPRHGAEAAAGGGNGQAIGDEQPEADDPRAAAARLIAAHPPLDLDDLLPDGLRFRNGDPVTPADCERNAAWKRAEVGDPDQAGEPLVFPLRGGAVWVLSPGDLARLERTFPCRELEPELRKAALWAEANPGRRKTAGGMMRFLAGWIGRGEAAAAGEDDEASE